MIREPVSSAQMTNIQWTQLIMEWNNHKDKGRSISAGHAAVTIGRSYQLAAATEVSSSAALIRSHFSSATVTTAVRFRL